ncbi:MAG TPA: DUF177 domain-containing protein [Gemmatimonadales bacterium]
MRDLQRGPVETTGTLEPGAPALAGLGLELEGPVEVTGRLQSSGEGEYLWRGQIRAVVDAECRRCLTPVRQEVDAGVDVLFSTDPEAIDDPSVYPLAESATHIDVTDAVREELALAVPTLVLCREDCAGLCPKCGADLNAEPAHAHGSAEPV